MMFEYKNKEWNIRKLADYVLLNGCSVNSTGLYNGKAGISLCLFEVARYLEDDYLEDQAFELLQESLLSKNEDTGFENGLSGIGFVLIYLIENKFIDADFKDFFGEQSQKIVASIQNTFSKSDNTMKLLPLAHFLYSASQHLQNDTFTQPASQIINQVSLGLNLQFSNFQSSLKVAVMAHFELFLKLISTYTPGCFPVSLLENYSRLYNEGKITSSFTVGFYLQKIGALHGHSVITSAGAKNMEQGIHMLMPDALNLVQQLQLLFSLLQKDGKYEHQQANLCNNLFNAPPGGHDDHIINSLNPKSFFAGYGSGIARLLLFIVYWKQQKRKQDVSRFQLLF